MNWLKQNNAVKAKTSKGAWRLLGGLIAIALLPASLNAAARTASLSGNWNNILTWGLALSVPGETDTVLINAGVTVTIDGVATSSSATIRGTVMASRTASSTWTVVDGDILVSTGGYLDYGNGVDPIPSAYSANLVLWGVTYNPGLIVDVGGNFTVQGTAKTPYAFASATIPQNATSLTVPSVVGWQIGDVITIGPTTGSGTTTTSTRTITGFTGTGPYTFSWSDQLPVARTVSSTSPIVVGNLTRNVLVRSSATVLGATSAYILNLARNTTSFALAYGEFAYLGKSGTDGKQGITFNGALTHGSISSSTVRNGYDGIYLNGSSNNTLTGNNFYSNSTFSIYLNGSSNNTLTGNNSYSNSSYGIFLNNSSSNNTLTGNNSYSNSGYGISLNSSSSNNTLTGNNSYSNTSYGIYLNGSSNNTLTGNNSYSISGSGIYLNSSSSNNTLAGNNAYSNSNNGIYLNGSSNNTLTGNNSYSNSHGIYLLNASNNTFAGGSLGYDGAGVSRPNTTAEIYFNPVTVETLTLKGARVNPAVGISTAGMAMAGSYLLSYNQDADTGTVRIWGNYQLAGSTLTLDYADQVYASTNTVPKRMRGTGHVITNVTTYDAFTLSELVRVAYTGDGNWDVVGSSSGLLGSYNPSTNGISFGSSKVSFSLTQGGSPDIGDVLDFVTVAASGDAYTRKKLLFGYSAPGYNNGRSKLEIGDTGGIVLKGKSDGTANTLIDTIEGNSTYYLFVDSGAFTAAYSSFTNMGPGGIQVYGDKGFTLANSNFDYFGFSDAASTNSYITARGLTANTTVYNTVFGQGNSPGGALPLWNVHVEGTNIVGGLYFRGAAAQSGARWGENYDDELAATNKVTWFDTACEPRTSANNGLWSAGSTWDTGNTPTSCSSVTIRADDMVTIDTLNAVSSGTWVLGTLRASREASSKWSLTTGDILISTGGYLDYGSEEDTIPEAYTAQIILSTGSASYRAGLIVDVGGNFTVRGATKTPYGFAIATIPQNATSLIVAPIEGWLIGDVITIGPTSGQGSTTTSTRTITNVTYSGETGIVDWLDPLPTARTLSSTSPIIVANLTRNVLVRSSGTIIGTDNAYILNLARNTTSFALAYGEFAYLGKSGTDGKQGITFNGAFTQGSISSSTVRNGYYGIYLNSSSTNTLTGNNAYSNNFGIYLNNASNNNTLTGNNSYSNTDGIYLYNTSNNNTLTGNNAYSNNYGIFLYNASNNTLTGNNGYSNPYGIFLDNSNNSTLTGNNVYSNSSIGIYLDNSNNNTLTENNAYSNNYGIKLYNTSNNNTLTGNNVYSNTNYGIYLGLASNNTFAGGSLGYDGAGVSRPNTTAEIYFNPVTVETLTLKGARVNPAVGISTAGMAMAGSYLLSYNQDADTGTVRIWGNYMLAGSTLTLDYADQVYASTNTAPKLMRGTGHSITGVTTYDTTLSELITVKHIGSDVWAITGSSSGPMNTVTCSGGYSNYFSFTGKVAFMLNAGVTLEVGDTLDFATIAASSDTNKQKKLLFGYGASGYNNGRSKLEIADTGGIVLKGKTDGLSNTLIDMIAGNSTYYLFVDSGAFTAEHSSFTNMGPRGIHLSGDKGVAISSSTFDLLGFIAGNNTYITARALATSATFYDVTFGLSRSSAGVAAAYNVTVEGDDSQLSPVFRKTVPSLGPLWGKPYASDAGSKIKWSEAFSPFAGCDAGVTVKKDETGDYTAIQAAINDLDHDLGADTCVVIRDTGTYAEQITVQGFNNNGHRLTIMADPAFISSAPVITTNDNAIAVFRIMNDSVTLQGLNVSPVNPANYGIWSSSASVHISSVNVISGGNISSAGMRISSDSAVSYSSITVQSADGLEIDGSGSTISFSTMTSGDGLYLGLYLTNASSNTITGSYIRNTADGSAVLLTGGAYYNTITESTVINNSSLNPALYISASDSNTVTGTYMYNGGGNAAKLETAYNNTVSSSTIVSTAGGYAAMYITDSTSNTVTGSYIYNPYGDALSLYSAHHNTISYSTMASAAGGYAALILFNSQFNDVIRSSMSNAAGFGLKLYTGAHNNNISYSTMTSYVGGGYGLYLEAASTNTIDSSYISNPLGVGAFLTSNSRFNTISRSTVASDIDTFQALYILGSSSNTVAGSFITNPQGNAVFLSNNANYNLILQSTMTCNNDFKRALTINNSSANVVMDSYAQGSTAVMLSGSTGTVIGGSVLISTWAEGVGLTLTQSNVNFTLSTSVVAGGAQGTAINFAANNSGAITLSSNIITGGQYGLSIASQTPGSGFSITSMTFQALTAGATAINFTGGTLVSTFTGVAFDYAGIDVNVNGDLLDPGSRIKMLQPAGVRAGTAYERDQYNRVDWPIVLPDGCGYGFNVAKAGGEYASIQVAITALGPALSGNTCVVIRDTQTYSEQVTVAGINTAGYRLTIMADPAFVSSAPVVNPPQFSTAAFQLVNASVTVQGINIISTNTVPYGIWSSSESVTISSVNVVSGGKIGTAGISISSGSAVYYSSVTVQAAHGLWISGSNSTVNFSTMTSSNAGKYALYLQNAASGTITRSYMANLLGDVAALNGADYNEISDSTMTGNAGGTSVLFLQNSDYNTVSRSYLSNPLGHGAFIYLGSDHNTVSYSTITTDSGTDALYLYANCSFNVITHSYLSNAWGNGALLDMGVHHNTISYSTITSGGDGFFGLFISNSSSNTVTGSYIQGSTAAFVAIATGTVIGGSAFVAAYPAGDGLQVFSSVHLTLDTNTFTGGPQGAAIYLEENNSGDIVLSSNIVSGGQYGLNIATQAPGANLSIASMTFQNLMLGATAINFLGGTIVSTFTRVAFDSVNININVNASLLGGGSHISMLQATGRAGQAYENDLPGYVTWGGVLPAGCGAGFNVRKDDTADYTSIQAALTALNHSLGADTCVVIRDTGTYSNQVTVEGFNTNGHRLIIMADPAFVSSAPVVAPLGGDTAGFRIMSDSVTVQGINIIPAASVGYGILSSSSSANITRVNVIAGGNISAAGIFISSYSTVSYSSVTVQTAHGLWLGGTGNMVSFSSMTSANSSSYALYLNYADSNTVTGSYMYNPLGTVVLLNSAKFNTISYSTVTGSSLKYSLYILSSDSNTVTRSHISNTIGNGIFLNAAKYNTISYSTSTCNDSGCSALYASGADFNAVNYSCLSNPLGNGLYLEAGSDDNHISSSAMTGGDLHSALYIVGSASNTVNGSSIHNTTGYGAQLASGADYNRISYSSITNNSSSSPGIYIISSDFNIVTGAHISNPSGHAAALYSGSDFNTISYSTMSSNAANRYALYIYGSSSNTVAGSYIQGSTAAFITGSTGTVINSSAFAAVSVTGNALQLAGGNVNLALTSSTFGGGLNGAGIVLDLNNKGVIYLTSNTITGGQYGLSIASQIPGTSLSVTSMTFQNLAAGATAINFMGGTLVSTFTRVAFDSGNITVNVNTSLLGPGSRLTMRQAAGTKAGAGYANDTQSFIEWGVILPAGCGAGFNVAKTGAEYASIQAAINALDRNLGAETCVVIRDTQVYSEQVTVGDFTNNGYRFTIMKDPAFISSSPVINPPEGAMAGFLIKNDSVTVQGMNIISTNNVTYGILSSSSMANISRVNVDSGNNILGAGIKISSHSLVEYTSITVQGARGLQITGSGNTVAFSTMTSDDMSPFALYIANADSNTVTNSYISNPSGHALFLYSGADYNTISYSTITASYRALSIESNISNVISGSYIQGSPAVHILSSTGTVIRGSMLVAVDAANNALQLAGGSVNLTLATSTFSGGAQGAGIYLAANNSGVISLSSNTITGGQYGLNIAAQGAGTGLNITSMTFQGLTAGATAINFLGGTFVSTFTGIVFNLPADAVNVNADLLVSGSSITIHNATGARAGPYFASDVNNHIEWDPISNLRFVSISSDTAVIAWTLGVPVAPSMFFSTSPVFAGAVAQAGGLNQGTSTYYGLLSNLTYYFKVAGENEYSQPISSATDAVPPPGCEVTGLNVTDIEVAWTQGNNAPGTRYFAEADLDEGFSASVATITQATSYMFTGLNPDNTYFMHVRALGVAGRDSEFLNMSLNVTLAYPPSSEVYSLISSTGLSVFWSPGSNPEWTKYELNYSLASNYIPKQTVIVNATAYEAAGLKPDTTYYFEARSVNGAGVGSSYYTFSATVTAAAIPAAPAGAALTPGANQVLAAWDQNDNPEDTQYYLRVSTMGDLTGTDYGPKDWALALARTVTGLESARTYYFGVKARSRLGRETTYFILGSTRVPSGADITPPTILVDESLLGGDATWRGDASGAYRVHFSDYGSLLDRFQVRVATGPGFTGTVIANWADVVTIINAEEYTTDWQLPDDIFKAITQDVTTYISVRVYDNSANVAVSTDVFYVRRDTTAPTIDDQQASPAGWLNSDPGLFNVNFADALSGLSRVRYSASSQANTANGNVIAWRDIAAFTSSAAYTADWGVDFAALTNGASNYISVQAIDNAGNVREVKDVFRILKNMYGPSVLIASPNATLVSTVTAFSGTATPMNEFSAVASVEITLQDLTPSASYYYNGTDFSSDAPVWLAAAGKTAWSFNASTVPFVLETPYEVRARALDINTLPSQQPYSLIFQIFQAAPAVAVSSPVAGSTVAIFDSIEGTAFDGGAGLGSVEIYVKRLFDDKWWNFTTGGWGETRIASAAVAGASWHFTPGAALRGGLAHGEKYFITARALDAAAPANASAYAVPGATFTCIDVLPPQAITELSASTGTSPGRINLVWTFPGDDGIGLPIPFGRYAVHYATYPEVSFSTQAAQVNDSTGPAIAGGAQSYTVSGLTPEATYYLSVWVADDAGLWSGASPVVHSVSGESLNNEISGTVKTPSGTGITGVIIEAYSNTGVLAASAVTLDDNLGSFTLAALTDGLYRVQATYVEDGFETSVAKDQIPMGYADVNFTLSVHYDLAAILGFIPMTAPSGFSPAEAGAGQVQLWQNRRKVSATAVDSAGRFAIHNLIPGRYTLKVADTGGVWKNFSVKLESGQTLEINPLGTLLNKDKVFAYPNPALTKVTFHAETAVSPVTVQISVFSLDGTLVKFVEEAVTAPAPVLYNYVWNFSGSQPASGVYFYTLRMKQDATGKVEAVTRKLAVVR